MCVGLFEGGAFSWLMPATLCMAQLLERGTAGSVKETLGAAFGCLSWRVSVVRRLTVLLLWLLPECLSGRVLGTRRLTPVMLASCCLSYASEGVAEGLGSAAGARVASTGSCAPGIGASAHTHTHVIVELEALCGTSTALQQPIDCKLAFGISRFQPLCAIQFSSVGRLAGSSACPTV